MDATSTQAKTLRTGRRVRRVVARRARGLRRGRARRRRHRRPDARPGHRPDGRGLRRAVRPRARGGHHLPRRQGQPRLARLAGSEHLRGARRPPAPDRVQRAASPWGPSAARPTSRRRSCSACWPTCRSCASPPPTSPTTSERYILEARKTGIIAAEVLADPQTDRSRSSADNPGLLKIVARTDDGVIVSGAEVGGLAGRPGRRDHLHQRPPSRLPAGGAHPGGDPGRLRGPKLVCREGTGHPGSDPFDHPIASRGEESEPAPHLRRGLIPNERIFNIGDDGVDGRWTKVLWAHWHILCRLWVKSQVFVGAAQAVVDVLGTGRSPPSARWSATSCSTSRRSRRT